MKRQPRRSRHRRRLAIRRQLAGLKYKHASSDPDSTFEVSGCYFENHKFYELANATAHARIHHNLFVGGKGANYAYASLDLGGPVHQLDQIFEYNTIYGIGAFYVFPNDSSRSDGWDVPKDIVFRNNIMYDKNTQGQESFQNLLEQGGRIDAGL